MIVSPSLLKPFQNNSNKNKEHVHPHRKISTNVSSEELVVEALDLAGVIPISQGSKRDIP